MSAAAPALQGRRRLGLTVSVLVVAAILLFAGLGHYGLWDDEAHTALSAKALLRSGDASAWVDDHNLLAYREGAELRDLKLRYLPPLPAYVAAPALALFGETAWAARLPFALAGLATVGVLLLWLWRAGASPATWALTSAAILGNTSFFLYARQSRYYALALLCSVVVAYCYVRRDAFRHWLPVALIASTALLATNYLNYAALYAGLALDYLLWGRRERALTAREWSALLLPQVAAAALLLSVWNPLALAVEAQYGQWLANRVLLLWWNLRDFNACEFGALPLIALAPLFWKGRPWLRRACVAFLAYVIVVVLASPQPTAMTAWAAVRYLVPLIPLCIIIEVQVLRALTPRPGRLAVLAAIVFGTNLFHGGLLQADGPRVTPMRYVAELIERPADPYRAAAGWINAHVAPGQSVWVVPAHMAYPLMYHAPHAVYAWQLGAPPALQFAGLPAIHFHGRALPDYIVAFGPAVARAQAAGLASPETRVAALDVFWRDEYRPELIFRTFTGATAGVEGTGIQIYAVRPPGLAAPAPAASSRPPPALPTGSGAAHAPG